MLRLTLPIALAILCCRSALGAPAPAKVTPKERVEVERSRPVTAADLCTMTRLTWCKTVYEICFLPDGQYLCVEHKKDGTGNISVWSGPWSLEGSTVTIEETGWRVRVDDPPVLDCAMQVRTLSLKFRAGIVIGTGWGYPLRMER